MLSFKMSSDYITLKKSLIKNSTIGFPLCCTSVISVSSLVPAKML